MASCDNTVLTGQEGLIQFKPLGTTNCVDDYCPFMGDRIYMPCSADYDIGDCLTVETVKIPVDQGQSADGGTSTLVDGDTLYIVNDGKGSAGEVDACGNDMEGVPYIQVSETEGGTPITWDNSVAGDEISSGGIATLSVTTAGAGYNGGAAGTIENVDLINTAFTGRAGNSAKATVVVGALGVISSATITQGGENYKVGDTVYLALDNGVSGTDAELSVATLGDPVRSNSAEGHYVFRLCDFQTVCGVRSFSLDLSRDELDVTTLPCSVSEACGKELASFRKTQAGFATATGTMEVYFTCDNESIQNKILQGSLQRTQGGASVRLYVCTKTDAQGEIDVDSSLFIEADIQLLGMSFSVNPDDPTTATINFGVTSVQSAFGLS
jgi:hypothetical protein